MSFADISGEGWLLLVAGWVHAVAATAWVGGSIFFAIVLRPAVSARPDLFRQVISAIGGIYRELVDASAIAIVLSGLVLMFSRLTGNTASPVYFVVLVVKLLLAAWMFYTVWQQRRSGWEPKKGSRLAQKVSWALGYNAVMAAGLVIYLLAGLLAQLYESSLSR